MMQLTRMSYSANSIAQEAVRWLTAAFEATYPTWGRTLEPEQRAPPMEEMLMIDPPLPAARMALATA